MNFFLGVLVMAIAILALKTVISAAAVLWRWAGRSIGIGWTRRTMRYRSIPFRTEARSNHPVNPSPDWEALSREFHKEILARGVRASSQSRRLCQLDDAIEIEKRETELARLRVEKSQLKARQKAVRTTTPSDRKGPGAGQSVVPIAQLKAMREATCADRSKQPTAPPFSPVHH